MQVVYTKNAPEPIGPYSQAIISAGTLYVSGQIPVDPISGDIPDSIEAQTTQVFKNIDAILKAGGADRNAVIKCSIFLQDMDHFKACNEVYASYFENHAPARECVEVARLPKNVLIEISCIAELA
jgi:2-iminobutanoate/2-iminopropanoate deaminase